jgi:hypothetical protein
MIRDSFQFVLLADIGEVVGAVIGLLALIGWIIQKVAEANNKQPVPARRPQPPQAQPQPAAQGGAARPVGQQADALRSQVEEFLRRAGQAQQGNQARPPQRRPQPAVTEIEVLLDDDALAPERRPPSEPLRPSPGRPAAPQPTAARTPAVSSGEMRPPRRPVTPRKRKTLAERADERAAARARRLAEHSAQLGQRIVHEDQQFDVQLKAKFDHAVGTLVNETVTNVELEPVPSDTPAARIAAMLTSPEGVRQAIVLNEILRPPTERW